MTPLFTRFVAKVRVPSSPDGCWQWMGDVLRNGYGQIQEGGKGSKKLSAHRLAYRFFVAGEIPSGMVVMHSCDNRACVNPAHLSAGSSSDNTRDAVRKGRWTQVQHGNRLRGEMHPRRKLNADLVREIRSSPLSCEALAQRVGVDKTTNSSARTRKTWAHVN